MDNIHVADNINGRSIIYSTHFTQQMLQPVVGAMTSSKGIDTPWSSEQEQHDLCATGCLYTAARLMPSGSWVLCEIWFPPREKQALLFHLETTVSWKLRCQRVSAQHSNKRWHRHKVKGRDWVIKQQNKKQTATRGAKPWNEAPPAPS